MGSNLNLSGEIECDASIMDGKSLQYGAVGAISGKLETGSRILILSLKSLIFRHNIHIMEQKVNHTKGTW